MSLMVFLTGVSLSMDAFSVAVTDGLCLGKIRFKDALKIGLFFGIFQGIMPLIGYFSGLLFADLIKNIDHWIAFFILGIIGFNMIREAIEKIKNPEECCFRTFKYKELFFQAIATSIDALAVGITFAALKVNIFSAASVICVITFLISFFGVYLGNTIGKFLREKAEIFGGSVLILIGIKILIEHLFF